MKLLAIDTALAACSVAVFDDGAGSDDAGDEGRLISASEELGRGHAERLMDMIGEVMAEAGVAFNDLDRIAVTVGPGSFTGLRVGLSVARGLALVLKIPVVGVTTLEAIGEGARRQAAASRKGMPVEVVLDARRDEVFHQAFAADGAPLCPPEVADIGSIAENLAGNALLCGSQARKLAELAGIEPDCVVSEAAWPAIEDVVRLGRNAPVQAGGAVPLYLRPPDAKPQTRDERLRV